METEKKNIREQIDRIDDEITSLLQKRLSLVKKISDVKKKAGESICDPVREQQIVNRAYANGAKSEDKAVKGVCASVFRDITGLCRTSELIENGDLPAVCGNTVYPIRFSEKSLKEGILSFKIAQKALIVTGKGVPRAYAEEISEALSDAPVMTLSDCEEDKGADTVLQIISQLQELSFSRDDILIAVGGGIVTDLVGFAASVYLRGIPYYSVPTTLLSMADASVGGKTGMNYARFKNQIGSFYPPSGVLICPAVLDTLDDSQYRSGIAEIIKIAAVLDKELFETLESTDIDKVPTEIIRRAIERKCEIVSCDDREIGLRRVLNFGHTVGHALESNGLGSHGECVAVGMLPFCSADVRNRMIALYRKWNLPQRYEIGREAFLKAVCHDKKSYHSQVHCVFCDEIGSYRSDVLTAEEIADLYFREEV